MYTHTHTHTHTQQWKNITNNVVYNLKQMEHQYIATHYKCTGT